MKLYEGENYKLYHGSMLDMPEVVENGTIDSIVTDPPYELNFMNKGWDNSGIAFSSETWKRCFDALKPGGYLLAFGGSRTYHRIACAIEDAGFEIRDTIMWLYGSGFPKSMNIGLAIDNKNGVESKVVEKCKCGKNDMLGGLSGKITTAGNYDIKEAQNEWNGWGTALKPSYEPIIVARKPCEGSCVDNVLKYGVGGINIDECRIGNDEIKTRGGNKFPNLYGNYAAATEDVHTGRFPANTILTYDDADFDEVCGGMPNTKSSGGSGESTKKQL